MHVEYLNHGITLKMVRIPEGAFLMGAPECEDGHYNDFGFRVACNVMQQTSYYLAPVG